MSDTEDAIAGERKPTMGATSQDSAQDSPLPLDVFLNGTRDYVQGTQLVARSIETLSGALPGPLTVSAAAFQRITDRTVSLRPMPDSGAQVGAEDPAAAAVLGSLVLRGADGAQSYQFLEGRDVAPRRDVPPACSYALVPGSQTDALSARFDLAGLATPEDYLVALIQSVKQLHEGISATVRDIWFTGLRAADLPAGAAFPCAAGTLSVQYRRLMQGEDAWQSLLAVELADPAGAQVTRSALSFAFKSETRPNVD